MSSDLDQVFIIDAEEAKEALRATEAAITAAERAGDRRAKALNLIKHADALVMTGTTMPQEAMTQVTEAQNLCEDLRFEEGRAAAMSVMGKVYAKYGGADEDDFEMALDLAQDSVKLFRKCGYRKGEAFALMTLATVQAALGRPDGVIAKAKESLQLFQELGEMSAVAELYVIIAGGYLTQGDTRRASSTVYKAAEIHQSTGAKGKKAAALHKAGSMDLAGGETEKALDAFGKAKDLYGQVGDHNGMAAVMTSIKDMHSSAGRFVESVQVQKEIITLFHNAVDPRGEGKALLKLAEMLLGKNEIAKASKVAEVAMGMFATLQDRDGMKDAMECLGAVKHARVKAELESVIDRNSDFMHVPRSLIVDPGLNKRITDEYGDLVRRGLA
mmetsp:Transcript_73605/g.215706  ORF Transcript_73605/g.215706 Transcript_73605/m.215706 type:complete len:386 (-) Transcript_73605:68-1225(-)